MFFPFENDLPEEVRHMVGCMKSDENYINHKVGFKMLGISPSVIPWYLPSMLSDHFKTPCYVEQTITIEVKKNRGYSISDLFQGNRKADMLYDIKGSELISRVGDEIFDIDQTSFTREAPFHISLAYYAKVDWDVFYSKEDGVITFKIALGSGTPPTQLIVPSPSKKFITDYTGGVFIYNIFTPDKTI